MATFVLSFSIVCLAVLGMAAGVLAGRRPIAGSCGGGACAHGLGPGCGACAAGERDGEALGAGREER
jgi:hypothetical protein